MKNAPAKNHPTGIAGTLLLALLLFCATAGPVNSKMIIYPAGGQSAEQQKQDEFECHQWAVEQTGFDPTRSQQAAQQAPAPQGGTLRGAAGGALVGVGIGAIAGDAKKGAAIGAGAGAIGGGAKQQQERRRQESASQQAQADQQARLAAYDKARGACLEGRGYTVK